MMCADFRHLEQEIRDLDQAGADMFHLDVMDGVFVPNFAMGKHDVEAVRASTDKLLDCHMMVSEPLLAIEIFAKAGADIMHVHAESTHQISLAIQRMRDLGVAPGVALNPGSPVSLLEPVLDAIEYILIMTVNPGFSGQPYVDYVDTKVARIVELREDRPITISVDGAVSAERVRTLSGMGVDGFILGTKGLFNDSGDYQTLLQDLREH